jgi:hypothetical protein
VAAKTSGIILVAMPIFAQITSNDVLDSAMNGSVGGGKRSEAMMRWQQRLNAAKRMKAAELRGAGLDNQPLACVADSATSSALFVMARMSLLNPSGDILNSPE